MAVSRSAPIEKLITGTGPGRALARRFVAGDTIDDGVEAARALNDDGFLVSLDLLGEEVIDRGSAAKATAEYHECLERIGSERLEANISVKPTQLGLAIDETLAMEAILQLAAAASARGTTVTLDMEDSRYTESTIRLFEKGQTAHGNLGIAVQSSLRRTPEDLDRITPLGGHVRLCKGAYLEPPEIALTEKSEVDAAYADQLRLLMSATTTKPAIATHDGALIDLARQLAGRREAPFEFQMLYGVRVELQHQLVAAGFPVRIYLPFGSQWYPYLTRRLAERPANVMFLARALLGD
jgi:proline dehydrogenase